MPKETNYWALLADPGTYGWNDLIREKRAVWDGIRNARAQSNLTKCAQGDLALIYHTAPDKAVMGIAKVVRTAYPDPSDDTRVVIDVEPVKPLKRPLPLADMKADATLADMSFVRMPRVAVQPVTPKQWERVLKLGG
jgi:predicted RNA-binding protein with PUA-like domain